MLIFSMPEGQASQQSDPVRVFHSAAYTIRALQVAHGRKLDRATARHALVKLKQMRAFLLSLENHRFWRPDKSIIYASPGEDAAALKPPLPISREARDSLVRDLDLFIFQLKRRFPACRLVEALDLALCEICDWLEERKPCSGERFGESAQGPERSARP